MGAVENIALAEHYRRAAVFISPSLSEGFGLTLVEAMGCACPVVASDLPAIREIISDGVTGLLCRQSDSQDIAAKVCWLLEHPERREELGRAGRQYVQARFDWAATADRYADLIDGLARKYP
jgi:glycosyltransferase involved in cell wall biosynthesis